MPLGLGTLLASAGIAQVAADALDKAAGMLFGARAKEMLTEIQDRVRAYSGAIPPNHDLEQAIRYAELTASIALLNGFGRAFETELVTARATRESPFIPAAKAWLHRQIGLCPALKVVPNEAVVAELNRTLDAALPADRAETVEAALSAAARQVWDQLAAGAGEAVPDGLEDRFFGREAGEPGWAVLFVAFLREQLKERPRARVAFVVSRLAGIADRLGTVEALARATKDDTGRLLAFAEAERLRLGAAEGFVHEMAGRVAAAPGLDLDGKMQAVRNAIELYVAEIAGGRTETNLGALVDAALARAKQLAEAGKSGLARRALRNAAEAFRREEAERRIRYEEGVRALYGRERDIALAAYDGEAAGEAVLALAEALAGDAEAAQAIALAEAEALFTHGRDLGSNVHLVAAIAIYQSIADAVPGDLGKCLIDLGIAFHTLGGRESTTDRLKQSVQAYCAALDEYNRDRMPLEWAMTQNNLGNVLTTLGARESGTALLDQAIKAYRAALQVHTRERVPLEWAMTQNNLGNVLMRLSARERGTALLDQAVEAYRAALQVRTRERVPLEWAMTQNNLGSALGALSAWESGTELLDQAIEAFRAALEEYNRERVPLDWAATQNNLGNVLLMLGDRESGTTRLEEAIKAFRAALEEYTRERVSLEWAMAMNNLGSALRALGDRESSTAHLEDAIEAYRAVLEEYTRERTPLEWARTQNDLGNALVALGKRESGTARLEQAVEAYRAALEEYRRETAPYHYEVVVENLERALDALRARR